MSQFHEFPKWKYHAKEKAVIVPHADAEKELGEGWVDSPVPAAEPEVAQVEEPEIEKEIQKNRPGRPRKGA